MATVEPSPKKRKKSKKKKKEKELPLSDEGDEVISSAHESSDDRPAAEPRYQVPGEYELVSSRGRLKLGAHTELWLIQAPCDFDPSKLDDQRVNIGGRHKVRLDASDDGNGGFGSVEIQSRFVEEGAKPSCQLLTATGRSGELRPQGGFHGTMKIVRCLDVPPATCPAPSSPDRHARKKLPEGLRARYRPFGSEEPFQLPDEGLRSQLKRKKSERDRLHKKKKKKRKTEDDG